MSKFCGKCGSKLNKNGLCPKCDATRIASEEKQSFDSKTQKNSSNKKELNKSTVNSKDVSEKKKNDKEKSKPKKLTSKEKKEIKKAEKEKAKESRTIGQKVKRFFIKLFVILLALIILTSTIIGLLTYYGVVDIPILDKLLVSSENKEETTKADNGNTNNGKNDNKQEEAISPDADSYFKDNSKVISETNAKDSENVLSEAEIYKSMTDRGFSDFPITTEYSMDGEYSTPVEITDSSSSKHPMYETYYINSSGEIWTIYSIDNTVMALPVTYNSQSDGTELVISEKDSVTSYDSGTNKFYETIPNDSELIVKKVSKIDKDTLDKLTVGSID